MNTNLEKIVAILDLLMFRVRRLKKPYETMTGMDETTHTIIIKTFDRLLNGISQIREQFENGSQPVPDEHAEAAALPVCFVAALRFSIFGMRQRDLTGLFQNIVNRNPILTGGFHTDLFAIVFDEPIGQVVQPFREGRKARLLVLGAPVRVGNTDTGVNPGLVDVKSTTIFTKDFKRHSEPPVKKLGSSAGTGCPAKSSRFERDKFTGCLFAPVVDALTDSRTI